MKTRHIDVIDEAGTRTQVLERIPRINTSGLDSTGSMDGLSSFHGPDGETLNAVGDGFVGVHSRKRYTRA